MNQKLKGLVNRMADDTRLYINKNNRKLLDDWDAKDILGFHMTEAKDIFLLASALGLDTPTDIGGTKDGYFRTDAKNYKTYDKALLSSVMLGTVEDVEDIDKYATEIINYNEAERCAESGFKILKEKIEDVNCDFELLEKRLISELNLLYEKNVKANL